MTSVKQIKKNLEEIHQGYILPGSVEVTSSGEISRAHPKMNVAVFMVKLQKLPLSLLS